jgi:hypothetical protein
MKELVQSSILDHLRGRIAAAYQKGRDPKELGDIALELLVRKTEIERKLDESPTFASKKEIEGTLEGLRELEKTIVSLYMLNRLRKDKPADSFLDFISRNYTIYHKTEEP